MAKLRRWGPWAWSADLYVGRPVLAANRPQLLGVGLVWASLSDPHLGWHVLTCFASVLGLHLVHLRLNRYSDIFYDFLLGQSVHANYILAQKHNLHILEGKVLFRDFIG